MSKEYEECKANFDTAKKKNHEQEMELQKSKHQVTLIEEDCESNKKRSVCQGREMDRLREWCGVVECFALQE